MIANQQMQQLLVLPTASHVGLSVELETLLSDVRQVDTCFFFSPFAPAHLPESFGSSIDATGFECSVNKFHIEDFLPRDSPRAPALLASTCVAAARLLADNLRKFAEANVLAVSFRIIGNVNGRASTLRFHALRPDESWLAGDLDRYEDAVFYVDTSEWMRS